MIVCGGLGPTQDDITRDVIADLMGVPLEEDPEVIEKLMQVFGSRGRDMPRNNLRQALVPVGASRIAQQPGTAPGLVCPVGDKVIFAVPGVPWEMQEMVSGTVIPELRRLAGDTGVIRSRTLRTWGHSESGIAEMLGDRLDHLDGTGDATIAFLASGIEGLKVRITAKAPTEEEVRGRARRRGRRGRLDPRRLHVQHRRRVDGDRRARPAAPAGPHHGHRRVAHRRAHRLAAHVGAGCERRLPRRRSCPTPARSSTTCSACPRARSSPRRPPPPWPRAPAGCSGATSAVAVTGVAGPAEQEGVPVGTVFFATTVDGVTETGMIRFPFDRERTVQFTVITVLSNLRRRLIAR